MLLNLERYRDLHRAYAGQLYVSMFLWSLLADVDLWCIHLSSPEQESYSEDETDRSAWTRDFEALTGSEIKSL